jgi:hypothetical protein
LCCLVLQNRLNSELSPEEYAIARANDEPKIELLVHRMFSFIENMQQQPNPSLALFWRHLKAQEMALGAHKAALNQAAAAHNSRVQAHVEAVDGHRRLNSARILNNDSLKEQRKLLIFGCLLYQF